MNYFTQLNDLDTRELIPGFHVHFVHTEGLTIAHFRIEQGSVLPEHQHPHEQVTNILEGTLEMTVNGHTFPCTPGTVVTIPGNTPHAARAVTDCKVIDVFCPVREDYR